MRSIGFIGAILLVCFVCFSNARNLAKWDAHSMLKSVDKLGKQLKPDDYFAFIPAYVGSILVGEPLSWQANCFETTTATLDIQQDYAYLYVSTSNKQGLICDDTYLIGNVADFDITYFEIPWNHTISWSLDGYTDAEIFDLKYNGFRVFLFPDSVSGSVEEIFETAMMFFGALLGASVPSWTAEDNVKFLKDHMNYEMKERKTQIVTLNESDIHSGDFLGIIRLDGLDPMLAWAMGSTTGHTAITLWIDGQLYVLESTVDSAYWPRNGVQKTPWKQWLVQAEAASYSVVHLPLSPQYRALFNETAAYEWFQSVEGLPYGFHAQFVGWIDTPEDNFPGVLSSHLVMLLMSFGDWLFRNELNWGPTFDFFAQSMNYRLGTQNLTVNEIYVAMAKQGMNFTDMLTMPELDSYTYLDNNRTGAAMVCDVLVVRLWKASGIFGSITDQIQGGEFTNWDAYSLNIFDSNYVRPSQCVAADPMLPYCQIMGKYRMTLNNYNQFAPYAHMRQTCGGHAPDYV